MEDQIIMLGVLSSAVIGINLFILKTLDSLCKRISRLEGRLHSQAWETFQAGLFNITSLIDSHGNRTNWFSWCSDNWNVRHSESWNSCKWTIVKKKSKECNSISLFFIKALCLNFESVTLRFFWRLHEQSHVSDYFRKVMLY